MYQLLGGELVDRVELAEPGRALDLLGPDEALVGQRHDPVEHVDPDLSGRAADRLRGVELPAADEGCEPPEQPLLALVQQVVAPGDRAAERLLPLRQVPRARGQDPELTLQPG